MRILLTRLTNDRHALEIVRTDGTRERKELETKSLWLHDLVHYAVESEAGLQDGFWGSLAAGRGLSDKNPDLLVIEMLVGALTGALNGVPLESVSGNIKSYLENLGEGGKFPAWLTSEYVGRVAEKLRQLVGHWNGTKFGATMELDWNES